MPVVQSIPPRHPTIYRTGCPPKVLDNHQSNSPAIASGGTPPSGEGFCLPYAVQKRTANGRPYGVGWYSAAKTLPSGHRAVTPPTALTHALSAGIARKTGHRQGGVPLLPYSDRYKFRFLMAFWAASSGVILPLRQSVTGSMTIWRMMRLGRAGVVRLSTQPFSS